MEIFGLIGFNYNVVIVFVYVGLCLCVNEKMVVLLKFLVVIIFFLVFSIVWGEKRVILVEEIVK